MINWNGPGCKSDKSETYNHRRFVAFGPLIGPQELEVRSLNHPYSLKTQSSQCHYVVMTRSETKFEGTFESPLPRGFGEN